MKILICLCVLIVVINASLFEEADVHFRSFKIKFEKFYGNPIEETKRFTIFRDNLKSIDEHNALYQQGIITWEKGITKYTDWTDEEYRSMLSLQIHDIKKITEAKKFDISPELTIPDAIDWRDKGQVTEVQDQGTCVASWAFSVTGSVEAAHYRKNGTLVPLSVQQLVDCTYEVGNNGCTGGRLHETFPYVSYNGLHISEDYPWNGTTGTCQRTALGAVTKIDSFNYFFANQYQLERVIGNIGPVSGTLDASEIKDYKSGIYESDTCDSLSVNLAVLIVGYGSANNSNYWIVRNCYGTTWGEEGYIRVSRKPNYFSCGLYFANVLPIIN